MAGLVFVFLILPLFGISLLISALALIFAKNKRRSEVARTILLIYGGGACLVVALILLGWIGHVIASPVTVERDDVIGTYRVDRRMFAGPQAEWQYDHYRMTITEQDTVILESLDDRGAWHTFERPIIPTHGVHSYLWRFPVENDSDAHHIICNTPVLHRQQWSFYYSFWSPRYGNVFFRKEE